MRTAESGTDVVAIGAGYSHCLALRTDGTVLGWGINWSGQTDIPDEATNAVAIAAGGYHSLARRADGTVLGWGANYEGQTSIPDSVYQLDLAVSVSGSVAVDVPGTYVLAYRATNALGAVGTATRTVVVADTLAPVLTLLGDNPLLLEFGAGFVDPGVTAADLCAGDLSGSIVLSNTVNAGVPGSYTNIYTVTDASGNLAQTNRTVTVLPPAPPVLAVCSGPAPGQFRLQGSGRAGLSYTLQASSNLVDWVNQTELVAGPGGGIEWVVEKDPNVPARFYRLRWP